jgi:hypothetical protein
VEDSFYWRCDIFILTRGINFRASLKRMRHSFLFGDELVSALEDPLTIDFYNGRRWEVIGPARVVVGIEDEAESVSRKVLDGV